MIVLSCFFAALGQLMFKIGVSNKVNIFYYINFSVFSGGIFYLAGLLLWLKVLSSEPLATVYPFTILSLLFVLLFSSLILKESISINQSGGITLILFGLYLVSK
ncbi:EamA family transporter [Vibrio superstes]|uniref:EamA family transporter n=1 Tax=Vibrio superstes TaxID=198815 RepID=UPI00350E51EF